MKQTVKKIGILMIAAVLLASPGWAKGVAKVQNTIHNMAKDSAPYVFYETNVDEICVFCHTPHGGVLDGPLWNHSMPATSSFTHYNSVTLSSALQNLSTREIGAESLLCMSCHDGSVAVNKLFNEPNSLGGAAIVPASFPPSADGTIVDVFGNVGARIGASPTDFEGNGDLSDDHPISFSYTAVLNSPDGMYQAGGSKAGELHPLLTAIGNEVRFFGSDNRVECSSCHDPHVDYETQQFDYRPFLITPNTGSALCLACHNK